MQTTCRGCHWNYLLQLDERGGHTWHTGTGICSHTHTPLQLIPTAKLSSKSLQGFSSADLLSGGHRELLPRALPCRVGGEDKHRTSGQGWKDWETGQGKVPMRARS